MYPIIITKGLSLPSTKVDVKVSLLIAHVSSGNNPAH